MIGLKVFLTGLVVFLIMTLIKKNLVSDSLLVAIIGLSGLVSMIAGVLILIWSL